MCRTVSKSISIDKANSWLDAIISKAIDIGEIITHYVGCKNPDGTTRVMTYTSYDLSDNFNVTVFSDFIAVTYFGKYSTTWYYSLTL